MVVRSMTITCERLKDVAFSTVYFQANQRVLARTDSGIREAADLGGKRACATTGSTSVSTLLALKPAPTVYGVADWTDCLVMLQQGDVDAVSTDDSILVGLQDQDPYLRVVGASLSPEPTGSASIEVPAIWSVSSTACSTECGPMAPGSRSTPGGCPPSAPRLRHRPRPTATEPEDP